MADQDPSAPSSAYAAMLPAWQMVNVILAGAAQVRAHGAAYLPQYEAESAAEYKRRLAAAPWRPEFDDALRSLSSKPFGKDVSLGENTPDAFKAIAEDVDARGHNLTAFAKPLFRGGIAKGMHGILVDYPSIRAGATLADERAVGARPYWVSVPAEDILALYTEFRGSKEIISHVRIRERAVERDGFGEREINRVRVLEPGLWQLWEFSEAGWGLVGEGAMTLPEVPLALFYTGERDGPQTVKPPLIDLADMQIELYRKLSRQDEIETYAGSPMLQAQGMGETDDEIAVGPKRILAAPPGVEGGKTGWSYVEPSAANLKEVRESVRDVVQDMRRLGMQPSTRESGNITATASSVDAARAHSAVQAWAIGLKDALEQAFVFTAQWLGIEPAVEVAVDTDFIVDPFAQAPLDALDKARARGDITQRTYLAGLRRFGVLEPDADVDQEVEDTAAEGIDTDDLDDTSPE